MNKLYLVLVVLLATSNACSFAEPSTLRNFITARGDQLYDGEERYRFISFNIPNLHLIEDNFSFSNSNPWRWPNEFEISDALETVRQMGGMVTRSYVLSVKREGSDMGDHVFVRAPGDFNEQAFRTLDKVLQIAHQKGIRVIIPLVDNWHWWGGRAEYAKFRGKEPDDFWTNSEIISDFEETIRFTLNRVNTFTGVAYKDDPAIFGWETGNELDSTPEWTRRISAYIKSQDSNHLVVDGYALHGVRQESLDDPNIDVITTHHYPNTDTDYVAAITAAHQRVAGKKPYFVGEFGFAPTATLGKVMDTIIDQNISGGLLWSLRFRRREGGFYWHSEPSGENFYKAYHWPGFDSGEAYHERTLLQLTQRKAFEINGKPVPRPEIPVAPMLLPIENVSKISWQGIVGATSYNVSRAENKTGPWEIVGKEVSDAAVQYRPLFNDQSAESGKSYFYRVSANNKSGSSVPSNIVGPVRVRWKYLVDECQNFEKLYRHNGKIEVLTRQARKVQEDGHRFSLSPGSSIDYHVREPINHWHALLFCSDDQVEPQVSCSIDGKNFVPCEVEHKQVAIGSGDYGYHIPHMLKGRISQPDARHMRVSLSKNTPDSKKSNVDVSRVEIAYGPTGKSTTIESERQPLGAQLNPSILLFHKPYHTEGVKYVRRAAELGCQRVNVVVTLHCEIGEENEVLSYGVIRKGKYRPINERILSEFRKSVQETLAEAVALDIDLSVLAHLNAGGEPYGWRNHFLFDPCAELGGYSYQNSIIAAVADGLAATARPDKVVDFSLSGEMGRSAFAYPDSYIKILKNLRTDDRLPNLKLGLSFNFNNASGEHLPNAAQQASVQQLVEMSDFLGMSNYRWFELPIEPNDFSVAVQEFIIELRGNGVTIPVGTPLHFSEVGIGGGSEKGLASTPLEASKTPWEGSDDPKNNPWNSDEMRRLRLDFHSALVEFLAKPSTDNPVTQAFLWSEGSWDPMDIVDRGFSDPEIIRNIQQHNERLNIK